ncbi:hypothetical protein L873DRAFT_1825403 [Choiromyces venosus 120613-1]|uniref:VLRF1 domain-containing protein n=1 Tax=Choiromyces venosus 120613-1 TaxID=1336337 RepID=A0A3N4K3V6_9PEZI|nr:hypothetical protein L873DRAFT_1825403 [Choiromyces venosus 120613-1]
MSNEEQLLKRPLYVFDLPDTLLSNLVLKTGRETPSPPEAIETSVSTSNQDGEATATSCGLCGTNSTTVGEQRAHVRSDFHRFNLKRKIAGRAAVLEAEFEKMLEDLNESISGSENDSESSGDDNDPLSTLLRRKARIANENAESPNQVFRMGPGKAPIIWYSSPLLPPTISLGVYRALFSHTEREEADYISGLQSSQLKAKPEEKPPHIFMCMIGGGHFAAMVVSHAPKNVKKQGAMEREVTVLAHKTFHRYTTRRKQGGAQSSNDSAKGNAQSAGAQIRRYNEAMLTTEVRDLLASWKELIDTAKLIFVRATGSANRRTLFGYEDALLRNNDPRIRGFPFTTRRATQSELLRCFIELTRMKISRIDEAALAALAEGSKKAAEAPTVKPSKPEVPKLTKEEEAQILHSTQLTALIRRSKAAALLSYLATNKLSPDFQFSPPNHHSPTLLHFAASSNSPAVVSALLTKAGSDPTSTSPQQPKTPFELAGDRATRDAFRVARAELGESKWGWTKARVPTALTKKQAEERERREKADNEKEEKARRQKELEKLKQQEAKNPTKAGGGRSLASSIVMGLSRREEEEKGLTPEAKARLERERRARAAEERIRKMQGK